MRLKFALCAVIIVFMLNAAVLNALKYMRHSSLYCTHAKRLQTLRIYCSKAKIDEKVFSLEKEQAELEYELQMVEAIRQRNEAQLQSFVDEKAQWEFQSQEDRDLLLKYPIIIERLDAIKKILCDLKR